MSKRQRVAVSIDASLHELVTAAIARGDAPTLTAWVDEAIRLKLQHDRRMRALRGFITAYEGEHGFITRREMVSASRWARGGTKARSPA